MSELGGVAVGFRGNFGGSDRKRRSVTGRVKPDTDVSRKESTEPADNGRADQCSRLRRQEETSGSDNPERTTDWAQSGAEPQNHRTTEEQNH